MGQVLQLDNRKSLLKQYYAGQRMESPADGFLILLRVRALDDGSAVALLECSASSLRYELPIPKATRTEKKKVKEQIEEGRDPDCPRHGPGQMLTRAGKELVCSACVVSYGKV
ncbi:MAG: hypothetical protein WD101_03150 [Gemmatimonadota bacterium]